MKEYFEATAVVHFRSGPGQGPSRRVDLVTVLQTLPFLKPFYHSVFLCYYMRDVHAQ